MVLIMNKGLLGTSRQIIAEEGAAALSSGLGATAAGYVLFIIFHQI